MSASASAKVLRIDFVSDIACPWCAVGLNSLERALSQLGPELVTDIHFQPYELNPGMARDGVDATAYLMQKYGMSAEQMDASRKVLRERGASVGFTFGERSRIWNTFDAHRLLCWAGQQSGSAQRALKHALLIAYHRDGRNPSDLDVLLDAAEQSGLDRDSARGVIESGQYANEVRHAEADWQRKGISAVPSIIINGRHLIQGGQPPEVFLQALQQLSAAQ